MVILWDHRGGKMEATILLRAYNGESVGDGRKSEDTA